MRVGILTFHTAKNIGAQLQAFALFYTLRKLGFNTTIIRYEPKYLTAPYKFFRNVSLEKGILSCCKQIALHLFFDIKTWLKTKKHYKEFQTKFFIISSKPYLFPQELEDGNFDAIVVGSDQIWNPEITNHKIDSMYTLNYSYRNVRKISYAASFSEEHISGINTQILVDRLKTFDSISVRESNLKDYLSRFFDKPIEVVLDPTLLVSREEWLKYISKTRIVKEKYVLLYQARGAKQNILLQAEALATIYGAKVYDASGMNYRIRKNGLQYVNPIEFLNLIFYAEAVITVSFHGTALSLILEKPFYSIALDDGRDGRVKDLLSNVGLMKQLCHINDKLGLIDIDYSGVDEKLRVLRSNSLHFLTKSLQ